MAFFRRHADHGKRTALAFAQGFELLQRLGRDGQYVAFLALVAPDFLGRHAGFLQRHGAQIKTGAASGIVGKFREGVAQTAGADVVNRENGVARALNPALVDDLLRPALNLGVAALYRIKIEFRRVGAARHRTGGAATHADAHSGAAQLDQQAAGRKLNLVGLGRVDHAQAPGNHDGLVVAALLLFCR